MSACYSVEELADLGFHSVGTDVKISRKCSIYGASNISIGDHVRIDDFCILSGKITIGNHVHISAFAALYGSGGISIGDFCGVSPRSTIFSASDDFSGEHMISPMVPPELTLVHRAPVVMQDFSQIGAHGVVLPGVTMGQGAVTGACTLVLRDLEPWTINVGIPSKVLQKRRQDVLRLARQIPRDSAS